MGVFELLAILLVAIVGASGVGMILGCAIFVVTNWLERKGR